MTHRRLVVPAAVAAALLGGASPARAADVVVDTACVRVVPTERTATVIATGFTPGATVTVRADGQLLASGPADAAGTLQQAVFAPRIADPGRTEQTFTLVARDTRGVASPPRRLLVGRLGVTLPDRARPTAWVRFRAHGFETGRPLYLHVRRDGRTLGRFALGRTAGACGRVSRRLRYMPLRRFTSGVYEYWFSHDRRYSADTRVYGLRVRIARRAAPA